MDDQIRKDRDRNWNLYTSLMTLVCNATGVAIPTDPLQFKAIQIVDVINALKNKPTSDPKADKAKQALKEWLS